MTTQKLAPKVWAVGIIGNILEWYDLTIYGYFSPILAKLFFPNENPLISLIAAFSVFAAGFLVRPLGALLFGHIADRFGRKNALVFSLLLAAIPTFFIGLTPTYSQIGLWAPVILTLFRLLQGMSAGGEYTSSILFLTEHAPENNRGFFGSLVYLGAGLGWLLGSSVSGMTMTLFSQEVLMDWAWRVPFLLGLITGLFGFCIRAYSEETLLFQQLQQTNALDKNPLKTILKQQKYDVAVAFIFSLFSTVGGYLLYAYMPIYLNQVVGISLADALTINTISLLFFTILVPITGWLSDRIGKRPLFLFSCLGFITCSLPLFSLFLEKDFTLSLCAMLVLTLFMAAFQGPFPAMLHEFFPIKIRASAMGLSYNLAAALFASTVPLFCTLLIKLTGNPLAVPCYLIAVAAISGIVLLSYKQASIYNEGTKRT